MIDSHTNTNLLDGLKTEAHVWYCFPESIQDEARLSEYRSVLSAQETERYHRFNFEKDKHSYLVSHALLRHVLSRYVDVQASQFQFTSNEHGKPELVLPSEVPGINFNLTHTDGLCACIATLDKTCGIDAENIHRKSKLNAVARRMFADEELAQLDNENVQQNFYYFWTLREAYVKALGTGLAGSTKDFYFDVNTADLSAVIYQKNKPQGDDGWQFRLYQPTQDYVLSVAIQSHAPVQIRLAELVP